MPAPTEWLLSLASTIASRMPVCGKNVIGAFWIATGRELAPHDHPAFGKINLLANLVHQVPLVPCSQGRSDELGANVTLAKSFLSAASMVKWIRIRAPKILIPEL